MTSRAPLFTAEVKRMILIYEIYMLFLYRFHCLVFIKTVEMNLERKLKLRERERELKLKKFWSFFFAIHIYIYR